MKYLCFALIATGITLGGCTTTYREEPAGNQGTEIADDEINIVPPVPSFVSVTDCELAYGVGACGTGGAVYESAGIVVPADANSWYIPYSFGVMTGVLLNHYFAPPAAYVVGVQYRTFTATKVINNYKVINQTTINNYRTAPATAQTAAMRAGPVRYSQSRGIVTGNGGSINVGQTHNKSASYGKATAPTAADAASSVSSYDRSAPIRSTASTSTPSTRAAPRSPSTNTYSPPTRAASTYTPPARTPTQSAYTPPRAPSPAYTPPRTAAPYVAPAKTCKTPPCR